MQHVVIIGGGAIGSSIAYHLAADPRIAVRVTVVERDPTYARASSALSASSIRQQFSTPLNIALSQFGLRFLRNAGDLLAVGGDRPSVGLHEGAYLFLASSSGLDVLRDNHAIQRAHGADVALLDPAALCARFPWLATDGVAAGSLGLSGEGWFDGPALLAAFRRKARSLGVVYLPRAATGFARDRSRVTAVRLDDGSELACDVAVNAAGAWAGQVAALAGLDLPIRPRRRMVFVLSCPDPLPACPLLIDTSGFWLRPEGRGFLCGRSPNGEELDPDEPPLTVEEEFFTDGIWPSLAARIPTMERLRVTASWAGYYEMNLFDHNGVVGPHPDAPNLMTAAGFSGHGIQHSPAVGRGVAELIGRGCYETLDLSPLAFTRILEGRPLLERNIV